MRAPLPPAHGRIVAARRRRRDADGPFLALRPLERIALEPGTTRRHHRISARAARRLGPARRARSRGRAGARGDALFRRRRAARRAPPRLTPNGGPTMKPNAPLAVALAARSPPAGARRLARRPTTRSRSDCPSPPVAPCAAARRTRARRAASAWQRLGARTSRARCTPRMGTMFSRPRSAPRQRREGRALQRRGGHRDATRRSPTATSSAARPRAGLSRRRGPHAPGDRTATARCARSTSTIPSPAAHRAVARREARGRRRRPRPAAHGAAHKQVVRVDGTEVRVEDGKVYVNGNGRPAARSS